MAGDRAKPYITTAESITADFESRTWTFRPVANFKVSAGRYVILRESDFKDMAQHADVDLIFESIKDYFPQATGWHDVMTGLERQRNRLDAYASGTASECARSAIKGGNDLRAKLDALVKAARTYVNNNLQDERAEPELCADLAQHAEIVALFEAIEEAEKP